MAGDLIPPPSPAGKPAPDAGRDQPRRDDEPAHEFLSSLRSADSDRQASAAASAPEQPAPKPRLAPDSPYRSRFGFILGALIGVGIAAVIVVVALISSGGTDSGPRNWSEWHPTDKGLDGVAQIADHVGVKYRLENGTQLVAVRSGPLEVADLPLAIAVRQSPTDSDGNIQLIEGKKGVMYTLNGLGPRGSIPSGKPTQERHLLLRREALELALYTFQYVKDVDLVVALLPPRPPETAKDSKSGSGSGTATTTTEDDSGQQPTQALFFRPRDLEPQLQEPLRVTIPVKTPRAETLGGREAQIIDSLTRPNLFLASFQQGQDAQAFLVLDRGAVE